MKREREGKIESAASTELTFMNKAGRAGEEKEKLREEEVTPPAIFWFQCSCSPAGQRGGKV